MRDPDYYKMHCIKKKSTFSKFCSNSYSVTSVLLYEELLHTALVSSRGIITGITEINATLCRLHKRRLSLSEEREIKQVITYFNHNKSQMYLLL